jgi:hypothetical protein
VPTGSRKIQKLGIGPDFKGIMRLVAGGLFSSRRRGYSELSKMNKYRHHLCSAKYNPENSDG